MRLIKNYPEKKECACIKLLQTIAAFQTTPYFFLVLLPILYATNFMLFSNRVTAFDLFFPFFLVSLVTDKNLLLFLQKNNFIKFILISIFLIFFHTFLITLIIKDINHQSLIKETIKFLYFFLLLGYGTYIIKNFDFQFINKNIILGYIPVLYAIIYSYIGCDILGAKAFFRTSEGALICVYLSLLTFIILKNKKKTSLLFLHFLIPYFCFFIFYYWRMACYEIITLSIISSAFLDVFKRFFLFYKKKIYLLFSILLAINITLQTLQHFYHENFPGEEYTLENYEKLLNIFEDNGLKERLFIWKTVTKGSLGNYGLGYGAGQIMQTKRKILNKQKKAFPFLQKTIYKKNQQIHNSFITLWLNFGLLSIFFLYFFFRLIFLLFKKIPFLQSSSLAFTLIAISFIHDIFFIHAIIFYIAFLYTVISKEKINA